MTTTVYGTVTGARTRVAHYAVRLVGVDEVTWRVLCSCGKPAVGGEFREGAVPTCAKGRRRWEWEQYETDRCRVQADKWSYSDNCLRGLMWASHVGGFCFPLTDADLM